MLAAFVLGLSLVPLSAGCDFQSRWESLGGIEQTYALDLSRFEGDRAQVAEEVKDIIVKRLGAYGFTRIGASVQRQDRLVLQIPGADGQSAAELKRLIEQVGDLTFRLLAGAEHQSPERQGEYEKAEQKYLEEDRAWVKRKMADPTLAEERPKPPDYIVRSCVERVRVPGGGEELRPRLDEKHTLENFHGKYNKEAEQWEPKGIVSGRYLSRVGKTVDAFTNLPAVHFELKGEGATAFADLTGANVGRAICIVLDDDIMEVATIRDRVTGSGQITGNYTSKDVRGIVTILRNGSLPAKPVLISEVSVGPRKGKAAGE